jgi:hypothetical protein
VACEASATVSPMSAPPLFPCPTWQKTS